MRLDKSVVSTRLLGNTLFIFEFKHTIMDVNELTHNDREFIIARFYL